MVALFARPGAEGLSSTMDMQYLPFFEDIREWTCASLVPPTAPQRQAVSALVDAFATATSSKTALAASTKHGDYHQVRSEDSPNPSLARFYSFLVQRALDKNASVPPPGPSAMHILDRTPAAARHLEATKAGEALTSCFGLEKVEKTAGGKRKRFWREAIAEKQKELTLGEVDTKRINVPMAKGEKKEEGGVKDENQDQDALAGGMAAPVGPAPAVHIGSVHPERDFARWLAHKAGGHDVVGEAMRQMRGIIERLADEGEEFHGKAMGCLKALRAACVDEAEPGSFNEFLRAVSLAPGQRQALFWTRVKGAAIGLISDAEAPTSTVTAEDARAFISGESLFPSPTASRARESGLEAAAHLTEQDLEAMLD